MKDVNGKVVAITGAAMGMGRIAAKRFAADGAHVALLDIKQADLDKTVAEITAKGGTARGYLCDLGDRERIYKTFKKIEKDMGPVDVLFNNAGVVFGGALLETDDDKLEATIRINLTAHLWTMKAVLPGMIQKNAGHIINFASAAGMVGVSLMATYCGSKAGVIGLTEAMRAEMLDQGHDGIKFTIVTPSYVTTGMFEGVRPPTFTPWLSPEGMVARIYKAFKNDKLFVRAPWIVYTIPALKLFLPVKGVDLVAKSLKMNATMKKWTGRKIS